MLHFLLSDVPAERFTSISHAAFELGCRLNTQFTIHRSTSTLPSDQPVVFYGNGESSGIAISPSAGPSEPVSEDGQWLYARAGTPRDIIQGTADLLDFRHEPTSSEARDQMGRVDPSKNPLASWLREPLIENNAEYLRRLLLERGISLPQSSTPFGDGRYAVCITHDVDGPQLHSWFALGRSLIYALRGDKYERESLELGLLTKALRRPDPYWNFALWQDLEKAFGARSTFLLYPGKINAARRHSRDPHYDPCKGEFPAAMKALASDGWDIGPHIGIGGHSIEAYGQALARIHDLSGKSPISTRTHYWAGMSAPLDAWRAMDAAGIGVDASLSPQALGYRGGAMMPIMPAYRWRGTADGIVAMPTPIMDAYIVPRSSGLSPVDSRAQAAQIIENARRFGGIVTLDWHVRTLCNAGAWNGYLGPLIEILNIVRDDGNATFMTMAEIGEAWLSHTKRCFEPTITDRGAA